GRERVRALCVPSKSAQAPTAIGRPVPPRRTICHRACMNEGSEQMQTAQDVLRRVFGFAHFRGVQQDVIDRVIAGRSALAVMPTGAGKSLTYQLPALVRQGTCVV